MFSFFFFNDTATTEIYTLSLHDALPIYLVELIAPPSDARLLKQLVQIAGTAADLNQLLQQPRSEEHTSELQSPDHLVCRLLLEKKKTSQSFRRDCGRRTRPASHEIPPAY